MCKHPSIFNYILFSYDVLLTAERGRPRRDAGIHECTCKKGIAYSRSIYYDRSLHIEKRTVSRKPIGCCLDPNYFLALLSFPRTILMPVCRSPSLKLLLMYRCHTVTPSLNIPDPVRFPKRVMSLFNALEDHKNGKRVILVKGHKQNRRHIPSSSIKHAHCISMICPQPSKALHIVLHEMEILFKR